LTVRGIRNALVVTPERVVAGGILFEEGRIAAVGSRWIEPSDEVIDAGGRLVIPGLVDAQAHLGVDRPAAADLEAESRAAVSSGVTTWNLVQTALTLSDDSPSTGAATAVPFSQVVAAFLERAEPASLCDFTLTPILSSPVHTTEIRALAETWGMTTFAIQMSMRHGWRPADWSPFENRGHEAFDDALVFAALREVGRMDRQALVSIHCENVEIAGAQATAGGSRGPGRDAGVREVMDVRSFVYLAGRLDSPLLIQNATDADTFATVARARADGLEVFAQSATFRLLDPRPDIRGEASARLSDPRLDLVTSMHVGAPDLGHPARPPDDPERDSWLAALPDRVRLHLPSLLSEGVHPGKLSTSRLCQLAAANPARILGLFPLKGTIRVGADADLVLLDLDLVSNLDQRGGGHLSTRWKSRELKGWPLLTLLRGEVAAEWSGNRCWTALPGRGRHLARTGLDPATRSKIARELSDSPLA
jgi:dihydropyrimidinase